MSERRSFDLMKSKWLKTTLAAFLVSSTLVGTVDVSAKSLEELKKEKEPIEQQKSKLNEGIEEKKREIHSNQSSIDAILDEISSLNSDIEETNNKMLVVQQDIDETKRSIEKLQASIADLEQKIKERDDVLRERMRTLQAQGNTSYVDVLLGATSFTDFIDRFSAVSTLMNADRAIMKQQQKDVTRIEEEKKEVEEQLTHLENRRVELEQLTSSLEKQKEEKRHLIDKLEEEQERLSKEKGALEDEYGKAYELGKGIETQIIEEQRRVAEEARRQEEARRAAEAAAAAQASESESTVAAPPVTSGTWMKPTTGRFTSGFGWRMHPIKKQRLQHRGIDIANSPGTPIVAAADGVVSSARSMGGLGNAIFITHSIDGKIFTSVYGHLSSIGVSPGQTVKKGEKIGAMGSTGNSTSSHLHFEIHVGTFTASGPSAVNPLQYIPL